MKERAERARAARAEREGAAATAQAYKSALGLSAKHDWGAKAKSAAAPVPSGALLSPGRNNHGRIMVSQSRPTRAPWGSAPSTTEAARPCPHLLQPLLVVPSTHEVFYSFS